MPLIDRVHLHDTALPIDRSSFDLSKYLENCAQPQYYNLREKLNKCQSKGIVIFQRCNTYTTY